MRSLRSFLVVGALTTLALTLGDSHALLIGRAAADTPAKLTGAEFWQLTQSISEPDGTFRSDNLLSNEMVFERMLSELLKVTKPNGVYLGVGPEQNFTYIAAMKSRIAFITDIRRANLHVLLMYKAVFELSRDRAEFISRLFSKPRPAGLTAASNIADILNAYWTVQSSGEATYDANLKAIQDQLTRSDGVPLPKDDLDGVAEAYRAFYWYGPSMNYSASLSLTGMSAGNSATYRDLMAQTDASGHFLTYLGSEETFAYVKDLEARNLIVPIVGDFGGPKAIRGIGAYLKSRSATVSAFYVSTVEPYLKRAGTFDAFCANVATLPMDDGSVFIRPGNANNLQASGFNVAPPGASTPRIGTYQIGVVVPMKTGCN